MCITHLFVKIDNYYYSVENKILIRFKNVKGNAITYYGVIMVCKMLHGYVIKMGI